MNALPVTAGPVPVTGHAGAATDGVVYWDTGALRWLPLPGRPVPAEPDPADLVPVAFTKAEVVALFGLLQWANQRSLGLAVQGDVRDAPGCGCHSPTARAGLALTRSSPRRRQRDTPA